MASRPPAFPRDVARRLQEPTGSVSFRYTFAQPLDGAPRHDIVLMETPYDRVLSSLGLDTKLNLRFTRVSCEEGARTAYVNVEPLCGTRHWDIALDWDLKELQISVREQTAPVGPVLEGRFPRVVGGAPEP